MWFSGLGLVGKVFFPSHSNDPWATNRHSQRVTMSCTTEGQTVLKAHLGDTSRPRGRGGHYTNSVTLSPMLGVVGLWAVSFAAMGSNCLLLPPLYHPRQMILIPSNGGARLRLHPSLPGRPWTDNPYLQTRFIMTGSTSCRSTVHRRRPRGALRSLSKSQRQMSTSLQL